MDAATAKAAGPALAEEIAPNAAGLDRDALVTAVPGAMIIAAVRAAAPVLVPASADLRNLFIKGEKSGTNL